MNQIDLFEYKELLIRKYRYECDNTDEKILERKDNLETRYEDEYLEEIISCTYCFISKILGMMGEYYAGYIEIPLDYKPVIEHISLNLTGGWISDTIVKDSDNNFYSIGILKKIFGPRFMIEPCKIEFIREFDEEDDCTIMEEIPSYYLYIQCKKEIIDEIKNDFIINKKQKKLIKD